eukprot:TRINITY_DN5403_c0_g1_i4.p1 TRINITY_DN5403_c0_g1~~TRINITY_DN5403_c0_g1_i4.p1  ORF type:complete len:1527 (+),score=346.76 TRINITY_DN5403_c0_g1_i4:119-4699(+)
MRFFPWILAVSSLQHGAHGQIWGVAEMGESCTDFCPRASLGMLECPQDTLLWALRSVRNQPLLEGVFNWTGIDCSNWNDTAASEAHTPGVVRNVTSGLYTCFETRAHQSSTAYADKNFSCSAQPGDQAFQRLCYCAPPWRTEKWVMGVDGKSEACTDVCSNAGLVCDVEEMKKVYPLYTSEAGIRFISEVGFNETCDSVTIAYQHYKNSPRRMPDDTAGNEGKFVCLTTSGGDAKTFACDKGGGNNFPGSRFCWCVSGPTTTTTTLTTNTTTTSTSTTTTTTTTTPTTATTITTTTTSATTTTTTATTTATTTTTSTSTTSTTSASSTTSTASSTSTTATTVTTVTTETSATTTTTNTTTTATTTTTSTSTTSTTSASSTTSTASSTSTTATTVTTVTTETSATTTTTNTTTTGQATSTTVTTAAPKVVVVSMTVNNVDYSTLMSDATILDGFKQKTSEAVAAAAGPGITAAMVTLLLAPGSIAITATISPPASVAVGALTQALTTNTASLTSQVVAGVQEVPGIEQASTGPITVSGVAAASVEGSAWANTTTTTASVTTTTSSATTTTSVTTTTSTATTTTATSTTTATFASKEAKIEAFKEQAAEVVEKLDEKEQKAVTAVLANVMDFTENGTSIEELEETLVVESEEATVAVVPMSALEDSATKTVDIPVPVDETGFAAKVEVPVATMKAISKSISMASPAGTSKAVVVSVGAVSDEVQAVMDSILQEAQQQASADEGETTGKGGTTAAKPKPKLASKPLSISLFDEDGTPLQGIQLEEPIVLTLMPSGADNLTCAYWDTENKEWSTKGVTRIFNASVPRGQAQPVVCETMHLSIFAAIEGVFQEVLRTVRCSNIDTLFNHKAIRRVWRDPEWASRPSAYILWVVLSIAFIAICATVIMDKIEAKRERMILAQHAEDLDSLGAEEFAAQLSSSNSMSFALSMSSSKPLEASSTSTLFAAEKSLTASQRYRAVGTRMKLQNAVRRQEAEEAVKHTEEEEKKESAMHRHCKHCITFARFCVVLIKATWQTLMKLLVKTLKLPNAVHTAILNLPDLPDQFLKMCVRREHARQVGVHVNSIDSLIEHEIDHDKALQEKRHSEQHTQEPEQEPDLNTGCGGLDLDPTKTMEALPLELEPTKGMEGLSPSAIGLQEQREEVKDPKNWATGADEPTVSPPRTELPEWLPLQTEARNPAGQKDESPGPVTLSPRSLWSSKPIEATLQPLAPWDDTREAPSPPAMELHKEPEKAAMESVEEPAKVAIESFEEPAKIAMESLEEEPAMGVVVQVPDPPPAQGVQETLRDAYTACARRFIESSWMYKVFVMMIAVHPWMVVLEFSAYVSHSARLALVVAEVLGSTAMGALFYSVSGGALSKDSDPSCAAPEDLWLEIVNAAAVATVTCALSDFVIAFFAMILMVNPDEDKKELLPIEVVHREYLQRMRRLFFWFCVTSYILFCIMVDVTFLANVTEEDAIAWRTSSAICLMEDFFLVPAVIGLLLATFAMICIRCRRRKPKEEDEEEHKNDPDR